MEGHKPEHMAPMVVCAGPATVSGGPRSEHIRSILSLGYRVLENYLSAGMLDLVPHLFSNNVLSTCFAKPGKMRSLTVWGAKSETGIWDRDP